MRAALHRVESDCLKPIYDNVISKEETLELVVPDVSADIGKILDVRGQLLLASQKARTDEIHISGSVEVTVIYAAEDSGKVQYVMANIPLDISCPVSGADENSKITSRWELCGLDARMLNPRKLLLRADMSAHVTVYAPDKFALWDNLSEGEKAPIFVLKKEITHTLVVGVREKSFVVSDEYRLPPEKEQAAKMISAETEICVEDAKAVGNKVIIKALAKTTAIFLNENEGILFDCLFTTQFSQIIEVDTFGDNVMNSVCIQLKDAEFTMVPGRETGFLCAASFQMMAQAVSKETKATPYVADAYSNDFKMSSETTDVRLMKCMPQNPLTLTLRGKLKSGGNLAEIMYLNTADVCAEAEGDVIRVSASVCGIGKSENGELEPIGVKLSEEESIVLMRNQKIIIKSVCCEKPMIIGSPNNAEVSVSVTVEYSIRETFEVCAVTELEVCEDCPLRKSDRPTLVVLCSNREADLWSVAKKYGSTVELIENANKCSDGFTPYTRPLLIPRAK